MKILYVTDRAAVGDERLEAVLTRLAGAPQLAVQLREKGATDRQVFERARRARGLLGPEVDLLINRRFDIALAAQAGGVHLPASGLPLARVRANTPRGFRVGVSTHSAAQAVVAIEERADVVVLGPIFATPSKLALGPPLGPDELANLPPVTTHETQVYAIGGVDEETVTEILPYRDRITGIAAVRWLQESADPLALARRIEAL